MDIESISKFAFGEPVAIDADQDAPAGAVDFADFNSGYRAFSYARPEIAAPHLATVWTSRRAEQNQQWHALASNPCGDNSKVVDSREESVSVIACARLTTHVDTSAISPKNRSSVRDSCLDSFTVVQAMPGFPCMPFNVGLFSLRGLMTCWSRRYCATTSQTGSPRTPSCTDAQPATL
jgi:hypothetical protein